MRDEIQAAYRAAHSLLNAIHHVALLRSHTMSISVPDVQGNEKEQWDLIQAAMQRPMDRKAPGLRETVQFLDEQLNGFLAKFEPIKPQLDYSYAAFGSFEVMGVSGRWAAWPLSEIGRSLSHWGKQFVMAFCNERAHVVGSNEYLTLQELREDCPVTDAIVAIIRDRLYLEESQLLQHHVPSIELHQPPAPQLTPTQQSYVLAGAVWLLFKEHELQKRVDGERTTEPTRDEAYSVAQQLGWQGTESQFKQHANEGTKPKWRDLSEVKAKEQQFLNRFLSLS